jgi:hypothetical protein
MKKIILFGALCAFAGNTFSQKETFDLTTYTPPKAWKKQPAASAVQFTKEDAIKGIYCLITLYKAVPGTSSSKENFDLAWASLVKEMVTASAPPEMQPSAIENGWEVQSGYAPFESDGNKGIVVLVTSSGFEKMVNLIILTNTDVYEKEISSFLESIHLKEPETIPDQSPNINDVKNPVLGTWGANASDNSTYRVKNGIMNYISRQYTFNADGSYSFVSKAFDPLMDKILLGKETGTYQINATAVSLNPKKSVLEGWSKKNGGDDWGKLISTQNIALEKTTYQYTKHYFSGIQVWNLVLQTDKATRRDGPYSNNTTFKNAWYYGPLTANNLKIKLPGEITKQEVKEHSTKVPGGFAFTTTNFDDGWTSTVKEDWVEATKENITVLIHYPTEKIDRSSMDTKTIGANAWNTLVAPRYSNLQNHVNAYISGYDSPYFLCGDLTDNATKKNVHVVLFKKGHTDWIEIITDSKQSFVKNFGVDINALETYPDSELFKLLVNLNGLNKFAVATSDLPGKWTNSWSGNTYYANIYTGMSAGMSTSAAGQTYEIAKNNTYKWHIVITKSYGGATSFQNAKSNGTLKMENNWKIHFSDMEGKPKTYNAEFRCVKGGRILWIDGTAFVKAEN